ncbi:MAG: NAD-dependent epimerase/dehydratase family protein [Flavobacteriales bacterium]|nr:NAD-dependent epimerase/dehydratase family protein [Flavobacteriales bacterium]
MKIAITGASGHLGSEIARQLERRGDTLKLLIHKDTRALEGIQATFIQGSMMDYPVLEKLLEDCDAVIHCAAIISLNGDPDGKVHQTNVEGTKRLLDTALKCGVKRFIHLSSIHAFHPEPLHEVLDETRELAHDNAFSYDRSKRDSQLLALSYVNKGLDVVVINPTSLIGPPDHKPSLQGQAFIDIYQGRVPAIFRGGFDFVDNRDVATAIIQSLEKGRTGECYLMSGEYITMLDMIRMVNLATGKKRKAIILPFWVAYALLPFVQLFSLITGKEPLFTKESLHILRHGNTKISSEKAKRELGFSPRPLQETVNDTMQWFKQNGYI